jgi:hypothetical protein
MILTAVVFMGRYDVKEILTSVYCIAINYLKKNMPCRRAYLNLKPDMGGNIKLLSGIQKHKMLCRPCPTWALKSFLS